MIVGSAAAALTGLQFVVIALVANLRRQVTSQEITAFASPMVVHFCGALFVSAALSAPWRSLLGPGLVVASFGMAGAIYALVVAVRTHRQTRYQPVFQDWLWYVLLLLLAHITLFATGIILRRRPILCLFGIAAATLFLVYIGIHNAWDSVHYLAVNELKPHDPPADDSRRHEAAEVRPTRLEKT